MLTHRAEGDRDTGGDGDSDEDHDAASCHKHAATTGRPCGKAKLAGWHGQAQSCLCVL